MRHRYPMFGQNARRCLRCSLYIRDRYTVCLLLHCGPLSTGLEAPSNEMPVVPVLLANPVKVLRLFSFRICTGAVKLKSSKQCAYTRHFVHIRVVSIGVSRCSCNAKQGGHLRKEVHRMATHTDRILHVNSNVILPNQRRINGVILLGR